MKHIQATREQAGVGGVPTPLERHLTPAELANAWRLDESTIRRLFQDEPGVFKLDSQNDRAKRSQYVTLRIPQHVAERVYRERSR